MKRQRKDGRLFFYKTVLSRMTLKKGSASIKFFKKGESKASDRNYDNETNPITNGNGGRIIALHSEFNAPASGIVQVKPSTIDILDGYSKLRNCGQVELKIGTDTVHQDLLSTVLPPAPFIFIGERVGTNAIDSFFPAPTGVANPPQSSWILRSSQLMIPFQKALPVKASEAFECDVTFLSDFVVPDVLEGYTLDIKLNVEVYLANATVARSE